MKVNRTAFRYEPVRLPDEDEVRAEIIEKVSNYGRVGYRKVTHMLRNNGRIDINGLLFINGMPYLGMGD